MALTYPRLRISTVPWNRSLILDTQGQKRIRRLDLLFLDQICEVDILKFVGNMPPRLQAVITAGGGHARW